MDSGKMNESIRLMNKLQTLIYFYLLWIIKSKYCFFFILITYSRDLITTDRQIYGFQTIMKCVGYFEWTHDLLREMKRLEDEEKNMVDGGVLVYVEVIWFELF